MRMLPTLKAPRARAQLAQELGKQEGELVLVALAARLEAERQPRDAGVVGVREQRLRREPATAAGGRECGGDAGGHAGGRKHR